MDKCLICKRKKEFGRDICDDPMCIEKYEQFGCKECQSKGVCQQTFAQCLYKVKAPKQFRVYENQTKLLVETDDKLLAVKIMRIAHEEHPDRWHELSEYWDGKYNGIRQYKPGDPADRW